MWSNRPLRVEAYTCRKETDMQLERSGACHEEFEAGTNEAQTQQGRWNAAPFLRKIMKKFFVTGITNQKGRFRVHNVTREIIYGNTSYILHLNENNILRCTEGSSRSLSLKTGDGFHTRIHLMFDHFEKEMLSKMTDPEKAKYLLTNR